MKTAYFNRFDLKLKTEDWQACSHSGQCGGEVKATLQEPYITRQFDVIPPEAIQEELKEYGAWTDEELQDEAENEQRILWIAACNLKESAR